LGPRKRPRLAALSGSHFESPRLCRGMVTLVFFLTACGGGLQESNLGDFPAITKTEGDASFALTPPSSNSRGGFTYSSSDPTVATIAGSTVTVLNAGTATITATQASTVDFSAKSVTAVLTVLPRACTAPATYQKNDCVAPATATGNIVVKSGRTWMPVEFIANWESAQAYCSTTTINGLTGWRLPNEFELSDLYASGMMNGQGWTLGKTWSSTAASISVNPVSTSSTTPSVVASYHFAVNLTNGVSSSEQNENGAYVACVR